MDVEQLREDVRAGRITPDRLIDLIVALSDLVVGSFLHHNLRFSSGDENVLGLGYLRRYRMVIDFPQRKIYLAKGKQFADLDREDLSGLHLLWKRGNVEVASVDDASPAALAGIRPGDVILEIQAKPAAELGLARIRLLLRLGHNEPITTVVERGGRKIVATFRLSDAPER
jgi:predicted metalloprotease with PDZ domain